MSKFAQKAAPTRPSGPIVTTGGGVSTFEGGAGFSRDVKSDLFLLAATNMVSESTFYEDGKTRDSRFLQLAHQATLEDADWVARFVGYLRSGMYMRSASLVMAAEYALALRSAPDEVRAAAPSPRKVISDALQRAEEPAEFIAYWISRTGSRTLPAGVQRGVADAVARLYNEYGALKYDGIGRTFRMGDVIELAHPKATAPWQGDLYQWLLDRRHNPKEVRASLERLPMVRENLALDEIPQAERRAWLRSQEARDRLKVAGVTWEELSGWVGGPMDAAVWESIIPNMGYMALLRNLRNFEQAGVSAQVANYVIGRLSDPAQVAKGKQFPYRFLSAYKELAGLRYGQALADALDHSVQNIPELDGDTLVLIDTSDSMNRWGSSKTSEKNRKTKISPMEIGALFGLAVARKCANVDVIGWASGQFVHNQKAGESLLQGIRRFTGRSGEVGHGTDLWSAVGNKYAGHKRVVIFSDFQTSTAMPELPAKTMVYGYNLGGFGVAAFESGARKIEFGGYSDKIFTLMPVLERGKDAGWPF